MVEAPEVLTLADFITDWQEVITDKVIETYEPRYRRIDDDAPLPELLRAPIGRQEQIIRGAVLSLKLNRGTTIVGEMGVGKTGMGVVVARMSGYRRVFVLCPPHLVEKWKREVEITLPGEDAVAVIATSITDLRMIEQVYGQDDDRTLFVIMSREKAKLSYSWEPAVFWHLPMHKGQLSLDEEDEGAGARNLENLPRVPLCPRCGNMVIDKDGVPLSDVDVLTSKKRLSCLHNITNARGQKSLCGSPLWQATKGRRLRPRIGLAEYIQKKMRHFFDLFIADEVHEYKARNSAQGISAGALASVCKKSLVLTGTLMGGYSSTLFYLLYRFYPEFRQSFPHSGESQWVQRYGFYEETVLLDSKDEQVTEHGSSSRRRGTNRRPPKELPGLLPGALFHLIEHCLFLRLSDVSDDLPPYEENVITVEMDGSIDPETGYSQQTAYRYLYRKIREALMEALAQGSQRLLGIYLQSLLSYPDGCTRGEKVVDPKDGKVIAELEPLDSRRIYPKEQRLLDRVREERRQGRRVLVYVTHTETRDITGRLKNFLEREGWKASVLKSGHPKSEDREKWVAEEVETGLDVLICHPRLVQTGLDLIDFPTIIWYETDYSVFTMRQASRRSWRLGQTRQVNVDFMTYEDCLQADALALVAAKMKSSLAVEGELPEEGLSTYGDSADNLLLMLAKQITGIMNAAPVNAQTIEAEFRSARELEREGDRELVRPSEDGLEAVPEETLRILKAAFHDEDEGDDVPLPASDSVPVEEEELVHSNGHKPEIAVPETAQLPSGQLLLFALD